MHQHSAGRTPPTQLLNELAVAGIARAPHRASDWTTQGLVQLLAVWGTAQLPTADPKLKDLHLDHCRYCSYRLGRADGTELTADPSNNTDLLGVR